MRITRIAAPSTPFVLTALLWLSVGCESDPTGLADVMWSEPENLGSVINSSVIEGGPTLSPDGLSLYFDSDRTDLEGARGARDIWVARRDCLTCDWRTPVNLGEAINTSYVDGSPELSADGLLLFFMTHGPREGCAVEPGETSVTPCADFIMVSRREDPTDDLAWGTPVSVGPQINDGGRNNEPGYAVEGGQAMLYFERGASTDGFDIFRAPINADGVASGPAEAVAVLNAEGRLDGGPTVSADGLELYYYRADEVGAQRSPDLWRATRSSSTAAWSAPLRLAAPANSDARDLTPSLSADGDWLVFASDRQGPAGNWDLYISQRLSND